MSRWVYLHNGTELAEVARHTEGGTYRLGGSTRAELNVTGSYGDLFRDAGLIGGLDFLEGMRAGDAIPVLEMAVGYLGTDRDPDYWKATPGNAGHALSILLGWARQCPDGTFRVGG